MHQLSFAASKDPAKLLLQDLDFEIAGGVFAVLVGPSGCGKSTLLRVLSGLTSATSGLVRVGGYDPAELRTALPLAVGYLPQFAAFHENLSVEEVLSNSMSLRLPGGVSQNDRAAWLRSIVELSGLSAILHQRVATLSGGQRRRLALAEELVSDPQFLLLDELTSGLDPHAELEMMQWMAGLVQQTGKTVVLVTHSVANLQFANTVLFLNRGRLLYDGPPDQVLPSFGASSWEEVYGRADQLVATRLESGTSDRGGGPTALRTAAPAGVIRQFCVLLQRQATLFFRDKGQMWLQLMLLITFPVLVAVFASNGLPEVRSLSLRIETSVVDGLTERLHLMKESFHVSSLVAGLSMFQVILLTLIGANNGAREIAKERDVLNKELRSGLSPFAYIGTKVVFVTVLSLVQSLSMTWFVKTMCGFPGELGAQFWILFLSTLAMSSTCLMFSAVSRSPERASLLAIYLVGLQLPLSGAVLALPAWLTLLTRPFIAAYWGWSGYLRTFESFRHYDIVQQTTKTAIAQYNASWVLLIVHVVVGLGIAWVVLARNKNSLH
ncbi:ATP-binding cassette domain-containing protein [Verrucomicrobium spinosum]|uniref:ATP-binding cassette domain-containing protein n=1 Tax=Verrucomicrobium spinosum TaxID=2736 RepID=UPI0009464228|nr:ATP-binding cassette domain-containing protein [Verrucomicrobium spinosum]